MEKLIQKETIDIQAIIAECKDSYIDDVLCELEEQFLNEEDFSEED